MTRSNSFDVHALQFGVGMHGPSFSLNLLPVSVSTQQASAEFAPALQLNKIAFFTQRLTVSTSCPSYGSRSPVQWSPDGAPQAAFPPASDPELPTPDDTQPPPDALQSAFMHCISSPGIGQLP
ncbi:MAG: hypothetical protein ABI488_12470 [Polyangiaceae bacterium]